MNASLSSAGTAVREDSHGVSATGVTLHYWSGDTVAVNAVRPVKTIAPTRRLKAAQKAFGGSSY
jgi:hypothetical protein